MTDILDFEGVVTQAANRIAYKMDAWDELEDIQQEMWLAIIEAAPLRYCSVSDLNRRLGTVGAKYVLAQKNLGMVMESQPSQTETLSSPLDHELIEWALPQIDQRYRVIIRDVLATERSPGNNPVPQTVDASDLKDAFRALSEVVTIYES